MAQQAQISANQPQQYSGSFVQQQPNNATAYVHTVSPAAAAAGAGSGRKCKP